MKKLINTVLKIVLTKKLFSKLLLIYNEYIGGYKSITYSQQGEDMVLRRLFVNQTSGFYVDVGAHHPKRFSNTYHFYKIGWRGINIDAMPQSMKRFERVRPRDINLELGISDAKNKLAYFMFNDSAFNTFSEQLKSKYESTKYENINGCRLVGEVDIEVFPLREVLDRYHKNMKIDFMNIDVEGFDLNVIKSNDWEIYRPVYLMVEYLNNSKDNALMKNGCLKTNEIIEYMSSVDYDVFSKTVNTLFFKDRLISPH